MALNPSSKLCFSKRLTKVSLLVLFIFFLLVLFSSFSSSVNKTTSSRAEGMSQQQPTLTKEQKEFQAYLSGTPIPTPTTRHFKSKSGEACFQNTCSKGLYCGYYTTRLADANFNYSDLYSNDYDMKCWEKNKIKADLYFYDDVVGELKPLKDTQTIEGNSANFFLGTNLASSFAPYTYTCDGVNFRPGTNDAQKNFICTIRNTEANQENRFDIVVKLYYFGDDEKVAYSGISSDVESVSKLPAAFTISKKITFKYKMRPTPTLAPTLIPAVKISQDSSSLNCKLSGAVNLGIANTTAVYNVNLEFYKYYPEAQGKDKFGGLSGFQHFSNLRSGDNTMRYDLEKLMPNNMYVMFARVYNDTSVGDEREGVLAQNSSLISGYLPLTDCQESGYIHPINSAKGCIQKSTYCEPLVGGNLK